MRRRYIARVPLEILTDFPRVDDPAVRVYIVVSAHDIEKGCCSLPHSVIEGQSGVPRQDIPKIMKRLEAKGYISRRNGSRIYRTITERTPVTVPVPKIGDLCLN